LSLAASAPLHAQGSPGRPPTRLGAFFGGAFARGEIDYSQSAARLVFLEEERFAARHRAGDATGFEGELQWRVLPHVGLSVCLSKTERDTTTTYSLSAPHPLYFARPREVADTARLRGIEETALHAAVFVLGSVSRLQVSAFAGVSSIHVITALLGDPAYAQEYPYDEIVVTSLPEVEATDRPLGWHAGAGAGIRIAGHVGLGLRIRYVAATARLRWQEGASLDLSLADLRLSAGLQIGF